MRPIRLVGGLLLSAQVTNANVSAAQPVDPQICAFLQDLADVSPDRRQRAKHEASRVFGRSGLNLVWTNDGSPFSAECVVVRMTMTPPEGHDRDKSVLGSVWRNKTVRAKLARVYYARIRASSLYLKLDEAVLLGHVIAHEIGHLLLPDDRHSRSGVMRETWDRAQGENAAAGLLTFIPHQVSIIRRHAAADGTKNPTLHVRIHDEAGVPAASLEQAQDEAAAIFQRARIYLIWVDVETCAGRCLVVKVIPRSVGGKSRNQHVVGVAPGTRDARGMLAFAFYDRISKLSGELRLEPGLMLGHVMAHELGHLLLPYEAHAVVGVMRPVWDRVQANGVTNGTLTFAPEQAESIRQQLSASALPTPRAR